MSERCDLCFGAGETAGNTCQRCGGAGVVEAPDRPCPACNGSGSDYRQEFIDGMMQTQKYVCGTCAGSGKAR